MRQAGERRDAESGSRESRCKKGTRTAIRHPGCDALGLHKGEASELQNPASGGGAFCVPSSREAEAGEAFEAQGQTELHSEIVSQNIK